MAQTLKRTKQLNKKEMNTDPKEKKLESKDKEKKPEPKDDSKEKKQLRDKETPDAKPPEPKDKGSLHHKHHRIDKNRLYVDFHENLVAIVDAKNQFNKRLEKLLSKHIHNQLRDLFEEARELTAQNSQQDQILIEFQKLLKGVSKWTSGQIYDFYNVIHDDPECKNVEEILRASCIGTSKVLSSIRTRPLRQNEKIKVVIPEIKSFIHKCLVASAKEVYANPYLFNPNVPREKFYKNQVYVRDMIKKCIADNIIDVLPIDDILNEYIQTFDTPVSKKEPVAEEDSKKKISDELAKEGYYDKEDHSFFSDSDIEAEDDDTADDSETDDENKDDDTAENAEESDDAADEDTVVDDAKIEPVEQETKPIKLSKSDLKELESAVAKPPKEVKFKNK